MPPGREFSMQVGLSRRGASASSAAVLIAIIAGLMVLYILFLPGAEREQLLFGDGNINGGYGSSQNGQRGIFTQYGSVLIFKDTPGTLRLQKGTISEHNIPSTTVYTRVQTQPIKSVSSAVIKNGVFAKQRLVITFPAERKGMSNMLLNFNVQRAGNTPLRVLLNGRQVFEWPVPVGSSPPIPLPVDSLIDGENTLVIEAGDVGLAFWKSNTFYLYNIQVTADVLDTMNAAAAQSFSITEQELGGMETAQLQFVPDCDPKKAGRLTVSLNERLIQLADNTTQAVPNLLFTGVPDCGVLFKVDVPREALGKENRLFFSADGQYILDRIKLIVKLKQNDYPVYYFNIPKDMYDLVDQGRGQVRLTMTFTDYRNVKTGEVVVNGFVQSFSTKDYVYQAVLDPGILTPGPNTVQIAPHVDKLDIAELKIELV